MERIVTEAGVVVVIPETAVVDAVLGENDVLVNEWLLREFVVEKVCIGEL